MIEEREREVNLKSSRELGEVQRGYFFLDLSLIL